MVVNIRVEVSSSKESAKGKKVEKVFGNEMEVTPINKLNLFSKIDDVGEVLSYELFLNLRSSQILKVWHCKKRDNKTLFYLYPKTFVILTE